MVNGYLWIIFTYLFSILRAKSVCQFSKNFATNAACLLAAIGLVLLKKGCMHGGFLYEGNLDYHICVEVLWLTGRDYAHQSVNPTNVL